MTAAQPAYVQELDGNEFLTGRLGPDTRPVEHDVRFFPALDMIVARCQPCWPWSVAVEGGHTLADLVRLERQHCGGAP